jgi:hypothetical protein
MAQQVASQATATASHQSVASCEQRRSGCAHSSNWPTLIFGNRPIDSITRRDIVPLLDTIDADDRPVMAAWTLADVGKVFNAHARSVSRCPQPDCARHRFRG